VSWARECPIRRQQVEKAQQAYACRPSKFQVRTSPGPAAIATPIVNNTQQEASPARASSRDPSPESVIEVDMPDQEPESETGLEPVASPKILACPQKRARPVSATTDSDSDFWDQGFTVVRRHKGRAS